MPTALELTLDERQRYIAAALRHDAVKIPPVSPDLLREQAALVERIRKVAVELKNRFGARRVILFGSLVHGAWFSAKSDVDIAVEGLAGDTYWRAWEMIERFIPDRSVDLVELETAKPSLRQSIETDGLPL